MATARDLIKARAKNDIYSVTPEATALDAMKSMHEKNIGALLVLNPNGSVAGILSERDFVHKLDVHGRHADQVTVREIMTEKVLYVEAQQPLDECMALMNEKNIRHLPVYEGDKLLGLISIRDVLREIIHEQKFMISQLEHYIRGE